MIFHRRVTPVDKLPVELLSIIFVLTTHTLQRDCADDSSQKQVSEFGFDLDSVRTPLILSSVNKRWRQIALSTAALWTSICVSIGDLVGIEDDKDKDHNCTHTLNTSRIESCLALSRKSPLDILIDARNPDWNFSERDEYVT
jgi:hypothetical protein